MLSWDYFQADLKYFPLLLLQLTATFAYVSIRGKVQNGHGQQRVYYTLLPCNMQQKYNGLYVLTPFYQNQHEHF